MWVILAWYASMMIAFSVVEAWTFVSTIFNKFQQKMGQNVIGFCCKFIYNIKGYISYFDIFAPETTIFAQLIDKSLYTCKIYS